ncbi:hypothetical protein AWC38_SpisGene11753 [Stylophora pistillata]|uniref:DDE Tnp4 domain-containing protein n=1 Tax=Stylophora pistillata TaxID=50429 RepID=A0A2B4S3R5_STYPI|nr:hypothetical protein AWC38_SpisGene11753 [Stylophora pistillata]
MEFSTTVTACYSSLSRYVTANYAMACEPEVGHAGGQAADRVMSKQRGSRSLTTTEKAENSRVCSNRFISVDRNARARKRNEIKRKYDDLTSSSTTKGSGVGEVIQCSEFVETETPSHTSNFTSGYVPLRMAVQGHVPLMMALQTEGKVLSEGCYQTDLDMAQLDRQQIYLQHITDELSSTKAWGGRVSDKYLTEKSGLLRKLLPGDIVLADRGFDIADSVGLYQAHFHIPAFTRGKKQLSAEEVEQTRKIAESESMWKG